MKYREHRFGPVCENVLHYVSEIVGFGIHRGGRKKMRSRLLNAIDIAIKRHKVKRDTSRPRILHSFPDMTYRTFALYKELREKKLCARALRKKMRSRKKRGGGEKRAWKLAEVAWSKRKRDEKQAGRDQATAVTKWDNKIKAIDRSAWPT